LTFFLLILAVRMMNTLRGDTNFILL